MAWRFHIDFAGDPGFGDCMYEPYRFAPTRFVPNVDGTTARIEASRAFEIDCCLLIFSASVSKTMKSIRNYLLKPRDTGFRSSNCSINKRKTDM